MSEDKYYRFPTPAGVNKAGVCNMTSHRFKIDATPPSKGKIRAGPYYDLVCYTAVEDIWLK